MRDVDRAHNKKIYEDWEEAHQEHSGKGFDPIIGRLDPKKGHNLVFNVAKRQTLKGKIGKWKRAQTRSGYYLKYAHGVIALQIYGVDSVINRYSLHVRDSGSGMGHKIGEYKTLSDARKAQTAYMRSHPNGDIRW